MALDTLTLKELQQKRQAVKNHLATVKGPEAEVVKTELENVEDMIRICQDRPVSRPSLKPSDALLRTSTASNANQEKLYLFLKQSKGQAFCDGCLTRETGVEGHDVATIAGTLALFPAEFRRLVVRCSRDCSHLEQVCIQAR
jgi:hypothetical protein